MTMCLAMTTTDGDERTFPLARERTVVGRDTRCDLRLAVPSVAPEHCEIVVDGNVLVLKDLDSDTGTFHNGEKVKQAVLADQDTVTVGPVTFVVRTNPSGLTNSVAEVKPEVETPAKDATRNV